MTEGVGIISIVILVIFLLMFLYYVPFVLWITAKNAGINIPLFQLFLMRLRKSPVSKIVNCMIMADKAGLKDVTYQELEAHCLAGGNIENVIHALVMAKKANIDLTFQLASTFDLAGKDVVQAVKEKAKIQDKTIDDMYNDFISK
jgi:uncharacterized protein YqfA (UPF0365 family)